MSRNKDDRDIPQIPEIPCQKDGGRTPPSDHQAHLFHRQHKKNGKCFTYNLKIPLYQSILFLRPRRSAEAP